MNTYMPKKRSFIALSVLAGMSLTSMHALAQEAEAQAAEEKKKKKLNQYW